MFSGIVECKARVLDIKRAEKGSNIDLTLSAPFAHELKVDQSVSHNGVCLTVVSCSPSDQSYMVTAIQETLDRSNLGDLQPGDEVNLERSMLMNGRLDGHIVQGHVDTTGVCENVEDVDGSTYFTIRYSVSDEMASKGYTTVEKGSVCVNGVSLTVVDAQRDSFRIAIIPYTMEHTNLGSLQKGMRVNLEFDIIGKYLAKMIEYREI